MPNVSSEILEKQPFSTASVACGCCSKTASKKSPAEGKHRASEGRASSEILRQKPLLLLPLLLLRGRRLLLVLLLLLLLLRCSCCAINQLPRQQTNSQTSFSKPTRNSKTPPNVMSNMTQNRSKKCLLAACCWLRTSWLAAAAYWLLAPGCRLVGYTGCCCLAAAAALTASAGLAAAAATCCCCHCRCSCCWCG